MLGFCFFFWWGGGGGGFGGNGVRTHVNSKRKIPYAGGSEEDQTDTLHHAGQ